jgi:hypothetical protein
MLTTLGVEPGRSPSLEAHINSSTSTHAEGSIIQWLIRVSRRAVRDMGWWGGAGYEGAPPVFGFSPHHGDPPLPSFAKDPDQTALTEHEFFNAF